MRRAARLAALLAAVAASGAWAACGDRPGDLPVHLTFDTGHMGVAPLVADVLARHDVKVTFFLADEKTLTGGSSLDDVWAPWWRARAVEGHTFGSHTMDHLYWLADERGGFRMKPSAGATAGLVRQVSAGQYCDELDRPARRFEAMTGRPMARLFRAPGGKTSPALLAAARACGWRHVGWSPAGFLGDELPSDRWPNAALLARALRDIRKGDVLVAHLGIWSRQEPWAPVVLEPLITGLKQRGFCFAPLGENAGTRDADRATSRRNAPR